MEVGDLVKLKGWKDEWADKGTGLIVGRTKRGNFDRDDLFHILWPGGKMKFFKALFLERVNESR